MSRQSASVTPAAEANGAERMAGRRVKAFADWENPPLTPPRRVNPPEAGKPPRRGRRTTGESGALGQSALPGKRRQAERHVKRGKPALQFGDGAGNGDGAAGYLNDRDAAHDSGVSSDSAPSPTKRAERRREGGSARPDRAGRLQHDKRGRGPRVASAATGRQLLIKN
jgi:hypothetical protein